MASNLKMCGPCERDWEHKDAVYWCITCREGLCKNCSKEHKKNRASANHTIVQLEDLSNVSESILSVNTLCEEHADKEISFYCTSHSKLCCATCIPTFHRICKDIITIEDASKGSAQSGALDDMQTRIDDLSGIFGIILQKQDDNINKLELQESKYKKEISERKKSIALELDRAEKTAKEHLTEQKNICVRDIMAKRDQFVKTKSHLETMQRDLKTLKEHASDQHIFITVKRLDAAQNEREREMQNQRKTLTHYALITSATKPPIPTVDSLFEGVKIGKTSMDGVPQLKKYTQCQIVPPLPVLVGKLTLKKQINLQEKTGENCGTIFKVCYFPVHDKAALTNTFTHSVYIYDMRSGHVQIVKLKEEGLLWYITTYDDNNALLAISGQLLKLNITDLTEEKGLILDRNNSGSCVVTCVSNYIVTCDLLDGISIFKNGRVLLKIPENREVGYVCGYDKDKIICTGYYDGFVRCVNVSGHDIFSLSRDDLSPHIQGPLGVAVDRDNYIYVASRAGILRLTPSGKIDKTSESSVDVLGLAYKNSTLELIAIRWEWLYVFKIG